MAASGFTSTGNLLYVYYTQYPRWKPNGAFISANGSWTSTGGSAPTIISDDLDATYIKKSSVAAGNYITYPMTDPVVASTDYVEAVAAYVRSNRLVSGCSIGVQLALNGTLIGSVYNVTGQSAAGDISLGPLPQAPDNNKAAWVYGNAGAAWTAAAMAGLQATVFDRVTAVGNTTQMLELGVMQSGVAYPYAPTVTAPAATVADSLTPSVSWTPVNVSTATITTKALTSNVALITTAAAHGYIVGQWVVVDTTSNDAVFDGVWQITAVTSTTFSFARTNANVVSVAETGTTTVGGVQDGRPQAQAEVRLYTAAQYGAGGFNPLTSTPAQVFTVPGTGTSQALAALVNGTTYRAYVRTAKAATGPDGATTIYLYGPQAFVQFTVSLTLPPTPTITPVLDNANQRVQLTVQAFANMIGADDSSFEVGTGTFAGTGCTLSRTTTAGTFDIGSGALAITCSATAVFSAMSAGGLAGVPCVAGQAYSMTARARTAVTARTVTPQISWYDSAGTFLSTTTGTGTVETTSFQTLTYNVTAPANAAFFAFGFAYTAGVAAEVHYVDKVGVAPGTGTAWSPGGATNTVLIQRTQGGVTSTVRQVPVIPGTTQGAVLFDYEALRGVAATYSATSVQTFSAGPVNSVVATSGSVTPSNDGFTWLKAPLSPAANVGAGSVHVKKGSLAYTRTEDQGVFRPLGRSKAVVVAGDLEGEDGGFSLYALTAAEWTALYQLLQVQTPILWQDPDGSQKYVRILSPRDWSKMGGFGTGARREVRVSYVETDAP